MNRILVGIIFSLFITTGYIAFLVYDRQQELQKLTHYTESWSVAQLVSEYYRFESWIGLYATETDDVTVDQVRMRLEIMLSQNDLLKEGGLGRYISSEKAHQALEKHEAQLKKYGPPALFVAVCIPLTGVGCWIGSTLARLTDMDEKRAGLAILGGTLVSGLITILGVYGLIGGIQYLLK